MIEILHQIDIDIFQLIRESWKNSLFDVIMPWLRNPLFWIPLYAFILYFMYKQFGVKGLWWCAFFVLTFGLCDFISASVLKPYFHRLRPCHVVGLTQLPTLIPCGAGYSFPSSHASNHFGLSFFCVFTLSKYFKKVIPLALLWALLVVYAQVYVGVHYPSDVFAGGVLGFCVGGFVSLLFKNIIPTFYRKL